MATRLWIQWRGVLRTGGLSKRISIGFVGCKRHYTVADGGQGDVDKEQSELIAEFNRSFEEVFGIADSEPTPSSPPQYAEPKPLRNTQMVNVGNKRESQRVATASGRVLLGPEAYTAVSQNTLKKGDVLSVARIAGILAAKQTSSLIPLCHTVALDKISVDFRMQQRDHAVELLAAAHCSGRTGVEMEALTAVSVAALTIYDMCKAVSKDIRITDLQLDSKCGGKSGDWRRQQRAL